VNIGLPMRTLAVIMAANPIPAPSQRGALAAVIAASARIGENRSGPGRGPNLDRQAVQPPGGRTPRRGHGPRFVMASRT
jgi:hypothetical protein